MVDFFLPSIEIAHSHSQDSSAGISKISYRQRYNNNLMIEKILVTNPSINHLAATFSISFFHKISTKFM